MTAAVLVLQLLATAPAFEPTPDPDQRTWYGWQPFIADATAACVLGGAFWTSTQPNMGLATGALVASGVGIYLFGGPSFHLVRQRPRTALLDLGMRVGFPLGGLMGGTLLALLSQQSGWILPGLAVGILAAIFTDVIGLSWEPPDAPTPPPAASTQVRWAPFAGAVRGAPIAGLAARF